MKPGQHDGEVESDAGPPEGALEDGPLAAQEGEGGNDEDGEERSDGAFGESGHAGEEVDIEEPEFGVGFVPGVPAEETDGKRRGHLHVSGSAAGEANDAGAGDGDDGRVEVSAGPESSHVQVDEGRHDEGEAGGRETGGPVVDAELLKDEHGAPVVERRLLKPGVAVEIRSDAGAKPALDGVGGVEAVEHFVGDLGVARLVGAYEADTVAAKNGRLSVEDEKDGEDQEYGGFATGGPTGQPHASALRRIRSRWFHFSLHVERFSRGGRANQRQPIQPTAGMLGVSRWPGMRRFQSTETHRDSCVSIGTRLTDSGQISTGLCSQPGDGGAKLGKDLLESRRKWAVEGAS